MAIVQMNFTPGYVLEYARNLAAHSKKDPSVNAAQNAMFDDIVTMLEIASNVMQPQPTDSADDKTIKANGN